MDKVTINFTTNTMHRPHEEKVTIKVLSGSLQGEVMNAFETCSTVANKYVNDLDKAGFKGATLDTAFIKSAFGCLTVQTIVRIPRESRDMHEMYVALKKTFKPFGQWANS